MKPYPGSEYVNKTVGYVVLTPKGEFKPFVGRVVYTGDHEDAIISAWGSRPAQPTIEEALKAFEGEGGQGIDHIFRGPVEPHAMGIWLSTLIEAEKKA